MIKLQDKIIRNCVFGIKCEKNWDMMEHIHNDENDNEVRFCTGCEKEVYATVTPSELDQNVRLNRCVALIPNDDGVVTTMGYITPSGLDFEEFTEDINEQNDDE